MIKSAHLDHFTRENLPDSLLWPDLQVTDKSLQYPERLNASVWLLDDVLEIINGNKIAVIDVTGEYTYQVFLLKVKKFAQFLEAQGVLSGNRVLLRGPNNANTVALWFAVIRVGAVAVTTIALQRAIELEKIISIAEVQFAFIDHRFTADWDAVTNYDGKSFIYGGSQENDLLIQAETFSGSHQACDTASDDVALLAFTSGSTGMPKATMHFHRDLLVIADTFSRHIVKPKSSDIFTGTPPIAFTFGLGGLVIFPFRVGATTVLFESITSPQLLEKIAEFKITCLFTAPTAYRAMLATATPENTASLRRCISAGEHLPKATW